MKLLETWYTEQTKQKKLIFDNAQLRILQQLDTFIDNFNHQGIFSKLFLKPKTLGYYIYGSVGRGKSMIMNELYHVLPDEKKTRLHFHEFMYNIQQELANLKAHDEPLKIVAKNLRNKYKIIFLDEMLVNDIANAMILQNLFTSLFNEGLYIITSSNDKPDNLYKDGLMRDRFMPAVRLLEDKLILLCLDSPNDYRLINSSINQLFIIDNPNAKANLELIFNHSSTMAAINDSILIHGRSISFYKKSSRCIWFEFKIICGDKRSQLDYLELVKHFEWFIIEGLYSLTDKEKDIVRRFTWLIDILYDHNSKLALSSSTDLDQLYLNGELSHEFTRTLSRLQEMQTLEYLNKPAVKF